MNERGRRAELWAAAFLQRQGLQLIAANYRSRHGEIDLIMRDGAMLVFVEVRLRGNDAFGGAAASIDAHKRLRIVRTAQHYLSTLNFVPPCRFDAVLLTSASGTHAEWLRNAFEA